MKKRIVNENKDLHNYPLNEKKDKKNLLLNNHVFVKRRVRLYYYRFQKTIFSSGPQTQSNKRASVVRFEDDENDQDSDSYDRSTEHVSMTDTSLIQTGSSLPIITQQSAVPTQKLFAHQFYDVYAGMTDEEWTKVRNAFVAQYFSE